LFFLSISTEASSFEAKIHLKRQWKWERMKGNKLRDFSLIYFEIHVLVFAFGNYTWDSDPL
jgi:hypothetical protein